VLLSFFELYWLLWRGAIISQNRRTHLMPAGSSHHCTQSLRKTRRPRRFRCSQAHALSGSVSLIHGCGHLLHPAIPPLGLFATSHPSEQVLQDTGHPHSVVDEVDKRCKGLPDRWGSCNPGHGDGRENEDSGKEPPCTLTGGTWLIPSHISQKLC